MGVVAGLDLEVSGAFNVNDAALTTVLSTGASTALLPAGAFHRRELAAGGGLAAGNSVRTEFSGLGLPALTQREGSSAERTCAKQVVASKVIAHSWRGRALVAFLAAAVRFGAVVRSFLCDSNIMGVTFSDTGSRDLNKPRVVAQFVNRLGTAITHACP